MKHKLFMYVSRWSFKIGEPGMGLFTFDPETGEMEFVKVLDDELSLGCSMIHRERRILYVVNECDLFPQTDMNTGRVCSFRINPETGDLTPLNHRETYCPFTSYVNTDPQGRYLVTSNHSWPNFITRLERDENGDIRPVVSHNDSVVNLFELNPDGSIGKMLDFYRHPTDGELHLSLLGRPHIPHPHCMMRSPSGKLFACCDKGDGHLYLYTIEHDRLKLLSRTLTDTPHSEPRYCMFHPTRPYLFINHEHTPGDKLTVSAFRYTEDGEMTKIGAFYADVSGFEPVEPHRQMQGMTITPDGAFLYTQAHGFNRILGFRVEEDGTLTQVEAAPITGQWPRAMSMSPDGKFLINCCLGGQITVWRVEKNGTLADTGHGGYLKGASYVSFF